jgi:glycosyltransferase involved in cell wall biosynthesis
MERWERIQAHRSKFYYGNLACFFMLLLLYLIPQARLIPLYNYLQLLLFMLWGFSALYLYPAYFQKARKKYILVFLYIFYLFAVSLLSGNMDVFRRFFGLVFFLLILLVFHFYQSNQAHVLRKFALFALIWMPIFNFISILFVSNLPFVIRNVFNPDSPFYQYLKFGVVGYDYVFALVILIPIYVYALSLPSNFNKRVLRLLWVNLLSGVVLTLLSGYTLAVMILAIGSVSILMLRKRKQKNKRKMLLYGLLAIGISPFLVYILSLVLRDTAYMQKIDILVRFLKTGEITGAILDARLIAYGKSLTTILHYPLTGLVLFEKIILGSTTSDLVKIGQHSAFLDSAAVFGLPMFGLLLYDIFHPIKAMADKVKQDRDLSGLVLGIGGMLFLILLLNNDIPLLSVATFFGLGNVLLLKKNAKTISNEILYIGFYDDLIQNADEKRNCFISSVNKMHYIIQVLVDEGYHVTVLSPAWTMLKHGRFKGKNVDLDEHVRLHLTPSFGSENRILRSLAKLYALIWLFWKLLVLAKQDAKVIVYHAQLISIPILFAKKIKGFKIVLELEEIYHRIQRTGKTMRMMEKRMIGNAQGYILPNHLMKEHYLARRKKPSMVIHGDYRTVRKARKRNDLKIELLFAGNVEKTRAGAFNAIKVMEHLGDRYRLHILGYGRESDLVELVMRITNINKAKHREAVIFQGTLTGQAYSDFLADCDIALNLQTRDNHSMDMAFPSKVVSYLAHGLHVISTRLNTLATSDVAAFIDFTDTDDPAAIAKQIIAVDLREASDPRPLLDQLDQNVHQELKHLIESVFI